MGKIAQIYLIGPVGIFADDQGNSEGFTIDSVIAQVQAFKGQDISRFNFKMKGPGGYVDEGESIFNYMNSLRSDIVSISTEQIGDIGSIMTKLFLAASPAKGEQRLVDKKYKFMIHNPWGGAEGNAADLIKYGEELDGIENSMRKFYAEETGITEDGLKSLMDKESEMSAETAVALGFATGYVGAIVQNKVIAMFNHKSNTMSKEHKTLLEKIKSLISEAKGDKPTALDYTMEGGTILRVDAETEDALVGASAVIIDADGQEMPAPEGDHILDDGRIISVDAGGLVTEIKEGEPVEPPVDPPVEVTLKADFEAMKLELDELKASFETKVEEAVAAKLQEVENAVDELTVEKIEVEAMKKQFMAMKTIYGVKEDKDFVKELNDKNRVTSYDEAKARLAERRASKPKFKRGNVVAKLK